ncbi:MAG TPA: acyl carrier protein [Gemmatimonadales bacterium]
MTTDQIMQTVRNYVAQEFLRPEDRAGLAADTPLVTGGILDSLASLNLVGFLENEYGIEIPAHEVTIDNLDTLATIVALVESKRP